MKRKLKNKRHEETKKNYTLFQIRTHRAADENRSKRAHVPTVSTAIIHFVVGACCWSPLITRCVLIWKRVYTVVKINLGLELIYLPAHNRNVCEH